MKTIILAAAAVLFAGPVSAQTLEVIISTGKGVTTDSAAKAFGNGGNTIINGYQSASPGIPAGTNAQIDQFQIGYTAGVNSIIAGNPAPNVGIPFVITVDTKALPLAR